MLKLGSENMCFVRSSDGDLVGSVDMARAQRLIDLGVAELRSASNPKKRTVWLKPLAHLSLGKEQPR